MEDPTLASLDGAELFKTQRLTCRRWRPTDVDDLYAVYADEEGSRYVGDGQPIVYSECERWLAVTANNYHRLGYGMFAFDDRETGRPVGFGGLVHPGGQPEAEIKYAFLRAHWGKGLASEVVPRLLQYGGEAHALGRIIATVAEGNLASRRVLAKAGMRHIDTYVEDDETVLLYDWP